VNCDRRIPKSAGTLRRMPGRDEARYLRTTGVGPGPAREKRRAHEIKAHLALVLISTPTCRDPADAASGCARLRVGVAVPVRYTFNGRWISRTFALQRIGSHEQFSEAVRALSPGTTTLILPPRPRDENRSCGAPDRFRSGKLRTSRRQNPLVRHALEDRGLPQNPKIRLPR
jgi:hypothetical protein